MSDEYLWDGSGEPDEQVVRLEKMLGQFRYQEPPRKKGNARVYCWLAAAAAVIAGLALIPWIWQRGAVTEWQLANGRQIRAGQVVETGAARTAAIESEATGHVDIEPGSRLRMVESGAGGQRFALERGTIHALIWAPPGRFVVDTPSAKTVDLGCRYTLQVSANGAGLVRVETGWVAFEWQRREAFIPAGAACVTRPGLGPGTPWFADAPGGLRAALEVFDTAPRGEARRSALGRALSAARDRDALSVWHLMVRTEGEERGAAFDRYAQLVTLPAGVTKEAVLRSDVGAIDGAWNALDLGSTDWWREWKRKW